MSSEGLRLLASRKPRCIKGVLRGVLREVGLGLLVTCSLFSFQSGQPKFLAVGSAPTLVTGRPRLRLLLTMALYFLAHLATIIGP